jgi:hypothetical protein
MPQISATVSWHFFSFLFGRIRDPARAKSATPAMSRGSPTGVTAKPMGIIRWEVGIEVCLPILLIAGRNRAAAPIFCITDESRPTVMDTVEMILFSFVPAYLIIVPARRDVIPFLSIPYPRIITDAIATTAFEAKPDIASNGLMRLSQAKARQAMMATRSSRMRLHAKRTSMAAITMPRRMMLLSIKKMKNMLRSSDQMVNLYATPLKNVPVSQ